MRGYQRFEGLCLPHIQGILRCMRCYSEMKAKAGVIFKIGTKCVYSNMQYAFINLTQLDLLWKC